MAEQPGVWGIDVGQCALKAIRLVDIDGQATATAFDYGTTQSKTYTDELRLSSSFKGKFNFTAGLYYSELTTKPGSSNYFVQFNTATAFTTPAMPESTPE